jgi:radical SAM superfamily enzyme YgiQ (UPF0313 family)
MKILLINPHYSIERYMGRHLARVGWVMPPMGLLYVAAALEREKHTVRVYDAQTDPRPLPSVLEEFRPAIVGITCVSALLVSARSAARLVKEHDPATKVVFGGVHASVRPEDVLATEDVDAAVRGEGVWTMPELAKAWGEGRGPAGIRGVSHRVDGTIVHEPDRAAVRDADLLPFPARHLVDMRPYRMSPDFSLRRPFDILFTAFGCPFHCIFCASQSVIGNVFRPRTIPSVMEELDQVVERYRIRSLLVGDDNFGVRRERAMEFCESYIARGYHKRIPWQVSLRVDCVDPAMLKAMKRAGCFLLSFGIESGVPRLLERLKKGITVEQSEEAVRRAREAGLRTRGTFILGIPTETREESLATIAFSRRLALDQVRFALATPFPGTELWDIAHAEGQARVEDWMSLSLMAGYRDGAPPYIPEGRDPDELKRLQRSANFRFFFRPRTVVDYLGRVRSPRDLLEFAQGAVELARASLFRG